jgi:Tol biopolymer transport system component
MAAFQKPYLSISISLAILLLAALVSWQSVTSEPHLQLAYLSQPDGEQQPHLSILDIPGGKVTSLHTGLAHDGCPTWSSDGKQILFIFGDKYALAERPTLYQINVGSESLIEVDYGNKPIGLGNWPGDMDRVSISPDNRKLAFTERPSGALPLISIVEIETLYEYQLPKVGIQHLDPSWSPDGKRIAFSTNVLLDPPKKPNPFYSIFIMNVDGSGLLKLTDDQGQKYVDDDAPRDLAPSWSPDGKRILFYTKITGHFPAANLFIVDVDGSHRTQITHDRSPIENITPVWSPDGKLIAFASNRDHPDKPTVFDIYTMKPDGSDIRRLTNTGNNSCPAWQPYPSAQENTSGT